MTVAAGVRHRDRREGAVSLFRRRSPSEKWGIDWSSPELQPINGVSLQTYVQVTSVPWTGQSGNLRTAEAEKAGVSPQDWTAAVVGWQVRIGSNQMVMNAMQLIMDPEVTPGRSHGA